MQVTPSGPVSSTDSLSLICWCFQQVIVHALSVIKPQRITLGYQRLRLVILCKYLCFINSIHNYKFLNYFLWVILSPIDLRIVNVFHRFSESFLNTPNFFCSFSCLFSAVVYLFIFKWTIHTLKTHTSCSRILQHIDCRTVESNCHTYVYF